MARVELVNLHKKWDDAIAVDGLSLSIEDGEFLAILGPSGCGKSTTLFMLSGVYLPSAGEIRFDGELVNDVEARDRNIGIVFQSYALYPNMTVLQNIMFPLRFKKMSDSDAQARAREIGELVQISELFDRRPSQLSGGQQQRVALARALVKRPNLLLLDEPLSNLDATLRLTMRAEIRRLTRELGVTTILVTHDQLEATTMADRVICMNAGRVEQAGTAEDLYLRPDTLFVAGFIGSPPINLLTASVVNETIAAEGCSMSVSGTEGAITLGLRPELVRPAEQGIPARIVTVEPMGRETLYAVETPLGLMHFLEPTSQPNWKFGSDLKLAFDAADSLIFNAAGIRLPEAKATLAGIADA
jgi:inositol-phosphate transport system ATP-binding protein